MTIGDGDAKSGGMGLDAVEIVMTVEDAFDIQIENSEAAKLLTPRLLIDCVVSKVSVATASSCLTHRAFNLFRKSLLHNGGWKRPEITPTARLTVLMPKTQRRVVMLKVTADLGIATLPEFIRPNWLSALVMFTTMLTGLAASVFSVHAMLTPSLAVWIFIGVSLLAGFMGLQLTNPLRTEFPRKMKTVGDLARWVMTHKADLANTTPPGWTREQIAARVREIVIDVLACEKKYREDANFVKDLGLS